jgi:UDP-GlcNAc:undecaprenyl-phosphate/decaprenyl-phosphate GlcNAc-1-phosphate transferase
MIAVAGSFVLGAALTAALWRVTSRVFDHEMLGRENVRGLTVPTAGGLLIVLAVLVPLALRDLVIVRGWTDVSAELIAGWQPMVLAVLGFGFLGLVDDLLGDASARGFGGHLQALRSGTVTTGLVKLVGGGVIAFLAVTQTGSFMAGGWQIAVDVALVALAANLANLFDRAPGRVTKVSLVASVALVVAAPLGVAQGEVYRVPPVAAIFVVGAAVGLLVPELREQVMLGDTGANCIGAALGLGAVMGLGEDARVWIMVVLLVLNLVSERVSFSRVIATTPGIRHLDQLGRRTD